MGLLTIGAFARATRLSPKALRLYDELGLLRPAVVDEGSGYRRYDPRQAERARLIAWLRRLGMPLARIREVCDAPPRQAARLVADYWTQVQAETAARGRLARMLVAHLSEPGGQEPDRPLGIRYAARSAAGLVRTSNEDAAYAGGRLLAVADGMRGPGGDRASAAAIDALKPLETVEVPEGDLLGALADAVEAARRAVRDVAGSVPSGEAATTLTAMVWSGSRLALAHIGDTRAYLLRDGGLFQLTADHTQVQTLVDSGRLTPAEAASHPQRALLARALTGTGGGEPDLSTHPVLPGDRWLLCTDGLSAVVPAEALRTVLTDAAEPGRAIGELVALAYAAGAPDNIAAAVADVVPE